MKKPYELTLELYDAREIRTDIVYVQRDRDTMPLYIDLQSRGEPFALPDGAAVVLNIEHPSGVRYPRYGVVVDPEKARIRWDIDQSEVSAAGDVRIRITVINGEERLSFSAFVFKVVKSNADDQTEPPDVLEPWKDDVMAQLTDQGQRITDIEENGGGGDVDLSKYATVAYVDEQIAAVDAPDVDLSNYYTRDEVDAKIEDIELTPGRDGEDGKDGKDGADGEDGKDGEDGQPGEQGVPGTAATIEIGTVTTGAPGTSAAVTNVGTDTAAVLDITIPRGDKGEDGEGGGAGGESTIAWLPSVSQEGDISFARSSTTTPPEVVNIKGVPGGVGAPGASTYDTWLDTGNEGTEVDFLRWVKANAGGNANIGEIFQWPLETPPGDALVCDGRDVSREEYAALFEVIGTQFGAGDGESTFGLPDIRGEGSMTLCVRYKRKELPWCAGTFVNRSIGKGGTEIIVPILESGNVAMVQGNVLVVPEEEGGVYLISVSGSTRTNTGDTLIHLLRNDSVGIASSKSTTTGSIPSVTAVLPFDANDTVTVQVNSAGAALSSFVPVPTFYFARIM